MYDIKAANAAKTPKEYLEAIHPDLKSVTSRFHIEEATVGVGSLSEGMNYFDLGFINHYGGSARYLGYNPVKGTASTFPGIFSLMPTELIKAEIYFQDSDIMIYIDKVSGTAFYGEMGLYGIYCGIDTEYSDIAKWLCDIERAHESGSEPDFGDSSSLLSRVERTGLYYKTGLPDDFPDYYASCYRSSFNKRSSQDHFLPNAVYHYGAELANCLAIQGYVPREWPELGISYKDNLEL